MAHLGRFTLAKKIALGYVSLLAITLASCLYSLFVFRQSLETDKLLVDLYQPAITALEDTRRLIVRTHRLTTNWIYQPNDDQKEELKSIITANFPEVCHRLVTLKSKWPAEEQAIVDEVFDESAFLFDIEKKIMTLLDSKESYFDSEVVQSSVIDLEETVSPTAKSLEIKISSLIQEQERAANLITEHKITTLTNVQRFISLSMIVSLVLGAVFAAYSIRVVVRPVNQLRQAVLALGKGELKEISIKKPNDEIGDMIESTNLLVRGLKKTTDFTEKIASGNFDSGMRSLSNIQALDHALFKMRESLITAAKVEKKRKWVIEGLANFSDVIRAQGLEALCESVISNLVKYLGAQTGGVFILNRDDNSTGDPYLELIASYAWSTEKLNSKIKRGEGLVGQCWKDGVAIHLTQVSESNVSIQSGLAQYTPGNVVIIPLKINAETFGVIELASFQIFDQYATEFLNEVSENIAAAIMSTINSSRTEKLLRQSQDQTEQLLSQEEEMRQMLEQSLLQTEQLQAQEEELRQNQNQLEETIRINSKLLSVISHDIKGPFASIKGLIQLYNNGLIKNEELTVHMKNIEKLIGSTDMLFSNILQWSIFYMNNGIKRQRINLSLVANNNINLISSAAQGKGNQIINDVSPEIFIQSDEALINLVLRNFISNANKFTENGSITIGAKKAGDNIEISVSDTGVGMSAKEIANLFSWETKHSTIGTRSEKGAGVGLLICKEFIENSGGKLYCASQKGEGSVFSFYLPSNEFDRINDRAEKELTTIDIPSENFHAKAS
jgi:signal transduction histidine kinase